MFKVGDKLIHTDNSNQLIVQLINVDHYNYATLKILKPYKEYTIGHKYFVECTFLLKTFKLYNDPAEITEEKDYYKWLANRT